MTVFEITFEDHSSGEVDSYEAKADDMAEALAGCEGFDIYLAGRDEGSITIRVAPL